MTSPTPSPTTPSLHLETERLRFERILMATDFSPLAEQALRTAISYANYYEAELRIVHALPPFFPPPELYHQEAMTLREGMGEGMEEDLRTTLNHDRERQLRQLPEQFPGLAELRHQEVAAVGPPEGIIAAISDEFHPDLIVMGTHGAGGSEKLIIGSTTESVLRHGRVPVLVIGPRASARASMPCNTLLLAADLTVSSLRAAQYATSLAADCDATLILLHVVKGKPAAELSSGERELLALDPNRRLGELVPGSAGLWCRPLVRTVFGDPGDQIVLAACQDKADLIVTGLRRGGPLADHATWSTLSHVLRHAHCPVLAVPAHG